MFATIIRDREDTNIVYAVVVSYETTYEEMEQYFDEVKESNPDWQVNDLLSALPTDCIVIGYSDYETIDV